MVDPPVAGQGADEPVAFLPCPEQKCPHPHDPRLCHGHVEEGKREAYERGGREARKAFKSGIFRQCTRPPRKNQDKCHQHGGGAPQNVKAAERRGVQAIAAGEVARFLRLDGHDPSTVDAHSGLLRLIAVWEFKVNLFGQLLGDAFEAAHRLRQAHEAAKVMVGPAGFEMGDGDDEVIPESPELQRARHDLNLIFATGGVSAFVGQKYDADRYGRVYAVDEGVRALEDLHGKASDRLGKYYFWAVKGELTQAMTAAAKEWGVNLLADIRSSWDVMGLSGEQRHAQQEFLIRRWQERMGPMVINGEVVAA